MRRPNDYLQKAFTVEDHHPQVTADLTYELAFECPADAAGAVIDRVLYVMPQTGLAQDDTNYVIVKVLNNAKVAASFSTKLTGGTGALTAGTQVKPAVSATASDVNLAPGDKLKLFLDCFGAPTVPAGKIRIEGRLL